MYFLVLVVAGDEGGVTHSSHKEESKEFP